jgi:hypothetical protein
MNARNGAITAPPANITIGAGFSGAAARGDPFAVDPHAFLPGGTQRSHSIAAP